MTEAILLTAGLSSRMQGGNKLLLDYNGIPLVKHVALALIRSGIERIILVTGHNQKTIEDTLANLDVYCVHNPNYQEGMVTSIQKGVASLSKKMDQFLITLGDMPSIRSMHIEKLLQYTENNRPIEEPYIFRPWHNHSPGHPVLFSKHFVKDILDSDNKHSLQAVIRSQNQFFHKYITSDSAFYKDIDTIDQYQKLIHE